MVTAVSGMLKRMAAPLPTFGPCPRLLRSEALRHLHDALPEEQRSVLAHALRNVDAETPAAWDGLFVARSSGGDDDIVGALWVQLVAGNTAVLWAPPGDNPVVAGLLRAAAALLDERRIPVGQLVVGDDDGYSPRLLKLCGFPRLCCLIYMYAELNPSPDEAVADEAAFPRGGAIASYGLQFVSHAADAADRLGAILELTYVDTLDCPLLEYVRPVSDVLKGYRAQGRYSARDWYFVRENDVDVGALILAEHPEYGNWEIVYMGVVPEARGRSIGSRIVRLALDVAAARGGQRLVLAVDETNGPALAAYKRCGFQQWSRRIVYARLHRPA
ncbi:MAG: hypothetical protein DCC67_11360 [Planctomycetota bacterium]|nr:MAG: hypothetical protein DCC67_11360 [Planctomycetota bacterium]